MMSFLDYCRVIILFLLLSLSYQVVAKTLLVAEGKSGNYQASISSAYNFLSKKIIDKVSKNGLVGANPLNAYNKLILPKVLKVVRLGRTSNGKYTRARVELNIKNYAKILEATGHIFKQEMRDFINSKGGSYQYLEQLLFSYKVLLAIKVEPSSARIASLRRDFFHLKKKLYELSYLSELRFIGEIQNAYIYINGQEQKKSVNQLLPGKHFFEIFKPKHFSINGSVMLTPGEKRSILVRMVPIPKKNIPINVVINSKLSPYRENINEVLAQLGFLTNAKTIFTLNIKWNQSVQSIDNTVGGVKKKKFLNLISIEIIDLSTGKILIAKDLHQEQTLVDDEPYSKLFIADMLRRSMYHLYPQIDRETLMRMRN